MRLQHKRGLIIGIANENSIAFGCARVMREQGAELALTYLNEKAEPYVRPLAQRLDSRLVVPCDVREPGRLEDVFARIAQEWGQLDFVLHSIAYAPKEDLHRRVTDCSQAGFAMAMDVSCHSFIRVARLAEPLMTNGGCLLTVTFYGAERAVEDYNLMGPVKAALEGSVRYLAAELGPRRIRVHALSPGHRLVDIDDVGHVAAFLASDDAAALTGNVEYIDGGYHVVG
ncbi:enoyl-ACP reductase FabI [Burkholderia pseudomallei]